MARFLYDSDPRSAFLLKGYAGTGKTSLVSALIQTLPQLRVNTLLLAPTGRAAKVISAYSGRPAFTIHKKIYMTVTDASGVVRTARAINKHAYTLFIVDEASMIGLEPTSTRQSLLEDLIDYVYDGNHCRLMLIGDSAQLPPVGQTESPALDERYLASAFGLNVLAAELTEVVRQQQLSGILDNATHIRSQITDLSAVDEAQMPLFSPNGTDVIRLAGEDLMETLYREYGDFALDQVVVVCRSNKRANLFNQGIRNTVLFREEEVNAGDYLMVVKNNYFWLDEESTIGFIANGDIVEVLSVRNVQELYGFRFAEVTMTLPDYDDYELTATVCLDTLTTEAPALTREQQEQLFDAVMSDYADIPQKTERIKKLKSDRYYNALQVKFSYAVTCHKAQGGQWAHVYLDQGYMTDDMLTPDYIHWLYTAFTRATEKLYLVNWPSSQKQ
jgi:ATP-dependent exoDNAse (exonuclease V) alpha subunit